MNTRIYGTSDDLIEVEGGPAAGEVGCYGTDRRDKGVLLVCSDGTILEVKYGKFARALWGIALHQKGSMFDRIEQIADSAEAEDAAIYSDIAHFSGELKWCYAATEWGKVR